MGFKLIVLSSPIGGTVVAFDRNCTNSSVRRKSPTRWRASFSFRFQSTVLFCLLLLLLSGDAEAWAAVRGPYLQSASSSRMTVRWRTATASESAVRYGTSLGALTGRATVSTVTKDHVVQVTGLKPDTTYFYSIGTPSAVDEEGPEYFFKTPPTADSAKPVRVWVLGDSGRSGAAAVRDGFTAFNGNASVDALLMLGDNAYENGTDSEYQSAVFERFPAQLRTTPLWPSIGNHDTAQSRDPTKRIAYTDIFSLPTRGECGGTASGTERYYSFDCGDAHFICLDSMTSSPAPSGAMAKWLRADLAATRKSWVVAYWHHAPYSKAGHDSDTDPAMRAMRENIVPILEAGGVDLVLCGHSHAYERSKLIDGHYGPASSFVPRFILSSSPSVYPKPPKGAPRKGTAYVVAGTGGSVFGPDVVDVPHPAMRTSFRRLGSVVLDIHPERLEVKFVSASGSVDDSFKIDKGPPVEPEIVVASGDDAYGAGTFRTFGVPSINDAGDVAFLARIATQTGSVNAIVANGIIAKTGSGGFTKLSDPMLNSLGEVAFFGTESGSLEEGLYSNRGGATARIARTGDVSPGTSDEVWKTIKAALFCDEWIAFTASLRGAPPARDMGLWFATPSETTLALREGDTLSLNDGSKTVLSFDALPVGAITRGHGYTPDAREIFVRVDFTDNTQAILEFTPLGFTIIAVTNERAPGAIFGSKFEAFGVPRGPMFSARLAMDFGGVTHANDSALFVWDDAIMRAFTEGGRPHPTLQFTSFKAYATVRGVGTAIVANVKGLGVTSRNDTGIWWTKGTAAPQLVAREGEHASGAGGRFKAFTSLALPGGANSAPVFVASVDTASNRVGLWGVDSTGWTALLLKEGQRIAGKTVRSFTVLNAVKKTPAQTRSVNSSRQIVARVTLTDHSQKIVVIEVP